MYRKLLKEAEEKKRRGLQEKIREIERKKASQKASTLRYFYRPMRNSSRRLANSFQAYAQILKEKEAQQRRETFIKRLFIK